MLTAAIARLRAVRRREAWLAEPALAADAEDRAAKEPRSQVEKEDADGINATTRGTAGESGQGPSSSTRSGSRRRTARHIIHRFTQKGRTAMSLIHRLLAPLWRMGKDKRDFFSAIENKDTKWFKRIIVETPRLAKTTKVNGVRMSMLEFVAHHGGTAGMVDVLIAYGAEVNVTNEAGETPLDLAIKERNRAVADALREHGGQRAAELAGGARHNKEGGP